MLFTLRVQASRNPQSEQLDSGLKHAGMTSVSLSQAQVK
jgi:hypothetical protein